MMTMTRLGTTTGRTSLRRSAALPKIRAVRDLAADWKCWSLAERVTAAVVVSLMVFAMLAMSTALASGGH